ncbi:MAG: outer-membrane lipoprotein carrier protein LolA [candidate division WOR-3 bacterium]|nr:MAG: outer-membrane lipoprotein carrier protein LolA [candidate division WOR-3 bacterium]
MAIHIALLCVLVLTPGADSVWEDLRDRYLALTTLSGSFDQTICSDEQGTCQTFSGSFVIEMPDRYRIEVAAPDSQLIVSDRTGIWFYFPKDNYAVRQASARSIPLMAFLEPMLDSTAAVSYADSTPGALVLAVTTADSVMSLHGMKLELDSSAGRIAGFSFVDAWGNDYHFRLSGQRWNQDLPEDAFSFTPPEGTIIE